MSQTATIDTCDFGHKFAKLADHPGNSCVHCLKIGLESARAEAELWDRRYCREASLASDLQEKIKVLSAALGSLIQKVNTLPTSPTLAEYRDLTAAVAESEHILAICGQGGDQ